MTGYITNGVLIGLHDHKAGQYLAIQKAACIFVSLLALVIIACLLSTGDGGQEAAHQLFCVTTPRLGKACGGPSSPSNFRIGYVGQVRIVADRPEFVTPPFLGLPEFGFISYPAPGVFESPHHVDGAPAPLSTDSDFGLPEPPPLWRFVKRGLPVGVVSETVPLLAQANLVGPVWPERVWLKDDTAVVYGILTMHSYGLMSFELVSENYPGRGFDKAVQNAVAQGTCVPAVNSRGERITVSCRYRCLFVRGVQPSVSVGASVTAIIKRD